MNGTKKINGNRGQVSGVGFAMLFRACPGGGQPIKKRDRPGVDESVTWGRRQQKEGASSRWRSFVTRHVTA